MHWWLRWISKNSYSPIFYAFIPLSSGLLCIIFMLIHLGLREAGEQSNKPPHTYAHIRTYSYKLNHLQTHSHPSDFAADSLVVHCTTKHTNQNVIDDWINETDMLWDLPKTPKNPLNPLQSHLNDSGWLMAKMSKWHKRTGHVSFFFCLWQ